MGKVSLLFIAYSGFFAWFSIGLVRVASLNLPVYDKKTLLDKLICLPVFLFASIFDKGCKDNFLEYLDPRKKAEVINFEEYKRKRKFGNY